MLPGRFNFGDRDEPQPHRNPGWFPRALALVVVLTLVATALAFDLGRYVRLPFF
jgi:hypothetical protein